MESEKPFKFICPVCDRVLDVAAVKQKHFCHHGPVDFVMKEVPENFVQDK